MVKKIFVNYFIAILRLNIEFEKYIDKKIPLHCWKGIGI